MTPAQIVTLVTALASLAGSVAAILHSLQTRRLVKSSTPAPTVTLSNTSSPR